jgi:hypothetical protein
MDGTRFDQLTRTLAQGTSRRRVLQGLAGTVAGVIAGRRVAPVDAACPPGQVARRGVCVCKTTGRPSAAEGCPCASGEGRCDGVCTKTPCACLPSVCPKPGVCRKGTCCQPQTTCGAGQCGLIDNGCGKTLDCGLCCTPVCDGRVCGDDGCGDSCGTCGEG